MTPGRRSQSRGRFTRGKRTPQEIRTTILLVCEGEKTEPNYFWRLLREDKVAQRFQPRVIAAKGRSRELAVRKAKAAKKQREQQGDPYDEVWVVVDVEKRQDPEAWKALRADAERHQIGLRLSNPCFEVWFLLHLDWGGALLLNGDQACAELDKRWRAADLGNAYEKGDPSHYDKLRSLTDKAISKAKSILKRQHVGKDDIVECNSATEVHLLVEHLLGRDASAQKLADK